MIDEEILAYLREMLFEHEPVDQIQGRLAIIEEYEKWETIRQWPKSKRHAETLAHTWSNAVLLMLLDYDGESGCKPEWIEQAKAVREEAFDG